MICHYIEAYRDPEGRRVAVWHRGNYLYELSLVPCTHLRWFDDMSLDEVRSLLSAEGYTLWETAHA